MSKKRILVVVVLIVLVAILVSRLKSNKEITKAKVYEYDQEQAVNVQADTLQLEDLNAEFSYAGTFEPERESRISAEVQGKINEVLVDAGSIVKEGQLLIRLDNSLQKLQLKTVEVQMDGLKADINRFTILMRADAIQGVQLEKAELGLRSAKVQRATLLEQINKTTVRAPFNGVVTAKLSEEGAFAAPGVPLLQITDLANLKFTINVSENDLKIFHLNNAYQVTADAYPEISLRGRITMIGSKANTGNSFPVHFTVNNTSSFKIKSGMFGKVNLKQHNQGKGIIISASSIAGSADQPQVYLLKNGRSVLQDIRISKKIQDKAVVAAGLKAGDIIITNGFINLSDSAKVTVK